MMAAVSDKLPNRSSQPAQPMALLGAGRNPRQVLAMTTSGSSPEPDERIAAWSEVLVDCFDGLITLTDVTGSKRQAADIVVHYVPTAGGVVFGGYAICGAHGCPNILVRSDLPPSLDREPYDPQYLGWVTLHELGHALGLGHATNLLESTDLMGYGWPDLGDPVLSDCDLDALAFVFAWALAGSEPAPPAEGPYDCSLD
jgi:hypothetical protein